MTDIRRVLRVTLLVAVVLLVGWLCVDSSDTFYRGAGLVLASLMFVLTWVATVGGRGEPETLEGLAATLAEAPPPEPEPELAGRGQAAFRRLAEEILAAGHRVTVLVGAPGSGKTVMAGGVAAGLAGLRGTGGPVPVLLDLASWDPVRDDFDRWLVRTVAARHFGGAEQVPRALYSAGLLLPVLDGLDTISDVSRRLALDGLGGRSARTVVTCRTREFEPLAADGGFRDARVVRIEPLTVQEIVACLQRPHWPEGTNWNPVVRALQGTPDLPLAAALSTPLVLGAAFRAFKRLGGSPADLLDTAEYPTRTAVERALVDRSIEAAFHPDPLRSGFPDPEAVPAYPADRAAAWLGFLARHLHDHNTRDLAWWRLGDRRFTAWTAPVVGLVCGIAMGVAVTLWARACRFEAAPYAGLAAGTATMVLAMFAWLAGTGREPGRLAFALRGSPARLRRGFGEGLALTALLAGPVLVIRDVWITLDGGWRIASLLGWLTLLTAAVTCALVLGCAMAVLRWMEAPAEWATRADPREFLVRDRMSALAGALAAGTVVGLLVGPALVGALVLGDYLHFWLTGAPTAPGLARAGTAELAVLKDRPRVLFPLGLALLTGTGFAVLVLLTRAWPRFVVVRAVLALRGRLPWRLIAFLVAAQEEQLFRASGGVFQFRHAWFQQKFAMGWRRPPSRRKWVLTAGGTGVLTGAIGVVPLLPTDAATSVWTAGSASVAALAYTRDGSRVAELGTDGTVVYHDARTGVETSRTTPCPGRDFKGMAPYSADKMIVGSWSVAKAPGVFEATAKDCSRHPRLDGLRGENSIGAVAPDGSALVLSGDTSKIVDTGPAGADRTIGPWVACDSLCALVPAGLLEIGADEKGQLLRRPGAGPLSLRMDRVTAFAVDRTGRFAALADGPDIHVLEIATGIFSKPLVGHQADVTALTFDASGTRLVSGSDDHKLRLWPLEAP